MVTCGYLDLTNECVVMAHRKDYNFNILFSKVIVTISIAFEGYACSWKFLGVNKQQVNFERLYMQKKKKFKTDIKDKTDFT